ncbi:MAG: type II toxin-antitoxin system PemK/MazF family toxin [Armatimonadetes bacterium]|nr:type II toxin-antitoxin system PemK/MazF family toxin [Armatimonadota bacterium]
MHRGEVWTVDLDPAVGSEQKKTRPAVIVSVDSIGKLPLRVVVPLTDWNDRYYDYAWMAFVANDEENGLSKICAADCLNIRTLDTSQFNRKLGDVRAEILEDILAAISIVLGLV